MPIYPYECTFCGYSFEEILLGATDLSCEEESKKRIFCPSCHKMKAKKIVGPFKIGGGILDTVGKSGYLTDELTIGKVVDEGGIPYEFKDQLLEKQEMIKRQVQYKKDLAKRASKFNFDPAGNDEDD